ncbi:hypothetical protein ACFX11_036556 [Malus domestica]
MIAAMAADVPVNAQVVNSCCATWKQKYSKLEKGRNALREAVHLLQQEVERAQAENSNLKTALKEERSRADIEKEEKEKASAAGLSLEKEISRLKSEISVKPRGNVDAQYKGEINLLKAQVSDRDKEINRLKDLIEREKKREDSASKNANVEKEEKVKETAARASLENEISELKSEIYSLKQRGNADGQDKSEVNLLKAQLDDYEKKINQLKKLIEREKKRADSASKNVEVEKKKASEARKSAKAEKSKTDDERKRANIEREKAENYGLQLEVLKKEAHKVNSDLASETLKLVEANRKLEGEKQKVVKEREIANSEKAKADEHRKFAEANRKMTMEEKHRAERLSMELVESRKRVDELQKEINEIRPLRELDEAPNAQSFNNRSGVAFQESKSDELKLVLEHPNFEELNKRYEIEKQKVTKEKKRAESERVKAEKQKKLVEVNWKKVMEEKSRADHLSRQLEDAKKKIEELSSRKLIDASAVELRKDKVAESAKVKHLKKQLKFEKKQRNHANEVVKLERSRNSILQQELGRMEVEFDQFSQRLGMLNKAFSHSAEGTDDLKKMNLQSGVKRLKPGCPVLDAREATQHTAPFLLLSGGNCTDSISGIDSILESPVRGSNRKMLQSSAIHSNRESFSDRQLVGSQEKLVEENVQPTISNLSAEVTKINCNENAAVVAENSVRSPFRTDGVGKVNEHSRKRKRILHAVESIEDLYTEGKKLHMRIEENLSVMHCVLNKQMEKHYEEGRYLLPSLQGNAMHGKLYKKGNEGIEDKLARQKYADSDEQKMANKFENEVFGYASICRQVPSNANELIGVAQAIREAATSDFETLASFDEVTDGNYLKLLDLDNASDEECYRMAMEVPLSPTLPEIEVQGLEASGADNLKPSSKESYCEGSSSKEEKQSPSYGVEVDAVDILGKSGDVFGNSVTTTKACDLKDSGTQLMSDAPLARNVEAVFPLGNELGYLVLSNFKDSSSISRICYAFRGCITRYPLITHTDWRVREILLALKTEEKLLPKEKVCIFFSLLLLNFSTAALIKFGGLNRTSNPCLDSYVRHMCSVMSDWEGRSIFAEFGSLEESLSIMEDSLINGRFVVCKDYSSETLVDGVHVSSRPASADELVAGSIVLASICAALDHTGFICEMSYNILQTSRSNHSLVLSILHVFAYLGGEKFLNLGNSNLVIIMKSIVTHLEGVISSDTASSFIPSVSNSRIMFSPCVKCPFSEDSVSVDAATSLLLERLQMNASVQPNTCTSFMLCDLSNLLSLVELVAIIMSWEWTSANIIPRLLKVMESCMAENVITGIVVLLGQLGRIGVNALGYGDKEVEFLRGELTAFLCRDSATSVGLPTQIATVTALLGLLSSDFKTIIQNNAISAAIGSQLGPAESIRKWFSLLPKKQQDFSFGLLQTAGMEPEPEIPCCKT